MARIQLSGLLSNITGKINGTVFQRTQGGLSMRNHSSKINSNTTRSNQQRVGISSIQGNWQSLTVQERLLWQTYALYLKKRQKKNPTLIVNGQQLFIDINSVRYALSSVNTLFQPYLLSTPVLAPLPQPIGITAITSATGFLTVSLDRVLNSDTEVIILYLSAPLLGSQQSSYKKMTLIKIATPDADSLSIAPYYTEVYGRIAQAGEWLQSKIAIYSTDSENYSSYSVARLQVS